MTAYGGGDLCWLMIDQEPEFPQRNFGLQMLQCWLGGLLSLGSVPGELWKNWRKNKLPMEHLVCVTRRGFAKPLHHLTVDNNITKNIWQTKIQNSNKQVKQKNSPRYRCRLMIGLPTSSCLLLWTRNPSSLGSYATETVSHGRLAGSLGRSRGFGSLMREKCVPAPCYTITSMTGWSPSNQPSFMLN